MQDRPSQEPGAVGPGPWRLLVLDRDPGDAKWVIAEVVSTGHVWPAEIDPAGRYADWRATVEHVRRLAGDDSELIPVHDALAWHVRRAHRQAARSRLLDVDELSQP